MNSRAFNPGFQVKYIVNSWRMLVHTAKSRWKYFQFYWKSALWFPVLWYAPSTKIFHKLSMIDFLASQCFMYHISSGGLIQLCSSAFVCVSTSRMYPRSGYILVNWNFWELTEFHHILQYFGVSLTWLSWPFNNSWLKDNFNLERSTS